MAKDIVKKLALYRWRFIVGYSVLALLFIGVLIFAMFYVPGGTTVQERASAVASASLPLSDIHSLATVNLPYLLLQKLSIHVFGLSLLSIKLPSVILSFLSAIGLVLLLKNWYRPATSLITAAIMLLSAQFLFISQQGTAAIMTVFWSVYIMLFAYIAIRSRSKWRYLYAVILAVVTAVSLYTPLMIYVLIALGGGAIIHPHMRYVIRKRSPKAMTLAAVFTVILCIPLIYLCIQNPSLIVTLAFGVNPLHIDWLANLSLVFYQLVDFWSAYHHADILTPIFSLPVAIIALIGAYSLFTRRHSVQSYVIITWILLVIPLFILNPDRSEIIFVPASLLVASGVSYLLWYWYGLFPKNPYARVAGLIPVAVLVGSLVIMNSLRYFYTFTYSPQQTAAISSDLGIINRTIGASTSPSTLVVAPSETAFYTIYAHSHNLPITVTVAKTAVHDFARRGQNVYATHDSALATSNSKPLRIITNDRMAASDRLYVYKNTGK